MQPLQYTLAVTLPDDETLDSFYAAGQTEAAHEAGLGRLAGRGRRASRRAQATTPT